MKAIPIYLSLLLALFSCGNRAESRGGSILEMNANYPPKYAEGFTIFNDSTGTKIRVFNPWQGASNVSLEYKLVPRGDISKFSSNPGAIPVPLERVVCMSSSHLAFIEALGMGQRIVGVSGAGFAFSSALRAMVDEGKIFEVGYDQGINYEQIARLNPDVIFCYGIGSESMAYLKKFSEMGMRIMFIGDYLESDPLGKAEWIKVLGCLFNCYGKADSIFSSIESSYLKTKKQVERCSSKPTIFMNMPFRGVWYFPGNDSYMVKLVHDAGGSYVFENLKGSRSFPLGIEKAFEAGMGSDIWLNPGSASSLTDITSFDTRLAQLPPVVSGKVYNNNLRMSRGGGNDFWESGTIHPELILHDLISIFHPEIANDSLLVYYQKLE